MLAAALGTGSVTVLCRCELRERRALRVASGGFQVADLAYAASEVVERGGEEEVQGVALEGREHAIFLLQPRQQSA